MNKNLKTITSLVLAMTFISSVTGCSKGKDNSSKNMIKYIEEKYESPEGAYVQDLKLLEDNKIAMGGYSETDNQRLLFISEDGGKTWSSRKFELPKKEEEANCNYMYFGEEGKILISYYFEESLEIEYGPAVIYPSDVEKGASELSDIKLPSDVEKRASELSDIRLPYKNPQYLYAIIDVDGTVTDLDLDFSKYSNDGSMGAGNNKFKCGTNGDIFITVGSGNEKIVQLDGETFKEKNVYKTNGWINAFYLVGDSLIVFNVDSVIEYDITNGKNKGNLKVLEKEVIVKNVEYTPTFFDSCSKDKLYYSDNTALYEYDVKAKKINKLEGIDISSFKENKKAITSFIEKGNGDFLAMVSDYSNNELKTSIINFTHNAEK